jgi:hypothetical protein
MVPNPGGRLFHRPRQLRERGRGGHQQAQNFQAARVRKKFDLVEGMQGLDDFHFAWQYYFVKLDFYTM